MTSEQLIFVGLELTEDLARALESCRRADRVFPEDEAYLETVEIDGARYLGRRLQSGVGRDRLEDTSRNVVSLVARVSGGLEFSYRNVRLIAVEEEPRDPASG